jgi:hypothetical protein
MLICSNTNKAVDQVLYSICNALGKAHPAMQSGQIVRLGAIADPKLAGEFGDCIDSGPAFDSPSSRTLCSQPINRCQIH